MAATKTAPAPVQVRKTYAAKIDPSPQESEPAGTIHALVSVFGIEDSYGDVVERGAFAKTIHEWALKDGRAIPLVWAHQFYEAENIIGVITSLTETDRGLEIVAEIDLDQPRAKRIHELMSRGLISEFSWSGMVREYEPIEYEDSWWGGMKILDVDFWEAGPCFKGANPDTELLSIKADGTMRGEIVAKAGRVLSQANFESLVAARDRLDEVISKAQPADDDDAAGDEDPADEAEKSSETPHTTERAAPVDHARALLELISTTTSD